jgi:hypothetical protein
VKILLDECIDRRLARHLSGHEVKTAPQRGWAGTKNGELLTLAQTLFDAFVTVDRNLSFQQNISRYDIAVVVLRCRSNLLRDLQTVVPYLLVSLPRVMRGTVGWSDAPGKE